MSAVELPSEIIYLIMEQLYKLNKSIVLDNLKNSTRIIKYTLNFSTNTDGFKYTKTGEFWTINRPLTFNNNLMSYYKFPVSPLFADFD